jgi:hypothetical protein
MTLHDPSLGTLPDLARLDDLEACVVVYLRLWSQGPDGQSAMRKDLVNGLGYARACTAMEAFASLSDTLSRYRSRPLQCHALGCARLHADEACLARFVSLAATADREDALWMAMLMVRPDMAAQLTAAAGAFGLRIKQLLVQRPPAAVRPARLH